MDNTLQPPSLFSHVKAISCGDSIFIYKEVFCVFIIFLNHNVEKLVITLSSEYEVTMYYMNYAQCMGFGIAK